MSNPYRNLPAVNEVLEQLPAECKTASSISLTMDCIRDELETCRGRIKSGDSSLQLEVAAITGRVVQQIKIEQKPYLRRVLNGTGVLLHTNLGRAPMAEAAAEAAAKAASGYVNLELDLETGKRSKRLAGVTGRIARLLGCEAATVVNNNAAATVLALRALAMGKEVVVSRGQLVEIGGSFRIPDIMATSGAILREVGTTNITRTSDYAAVIREETRVLLRVHPSNYRIIGHCEEPGIEELVELAKGTKRNSPLWVVDDIGSGAMHDMETWGLTHEPLAKKSLAAGADLVMFSGDKLFGGPQSGILAGRKKLIQAIEADPLMRAFRIDKMQLAALEATILLYQQGEEGRMQIPLYQMLEADTQGLMDRAHLLVRYLGNMPGVAGFVKPTEAFVGGGSLPGQTISSVAVQLRCDKYSAEELGQRLRTGDPAIMPRIESENVLVDLLAIPSREDQELLEAISRAVV